MAFDAGAVVGEVRLRTQDWKTGVQTVKSDIRDLKAETRSLGESIRGMAATLTGIGVAVGGFFGIALKGASDAQESMNLFRESFGELADEADRWANDLSNALGMSIKQVREFAGIMMVMTQGMGISARAALEISENLTRLAFDIASFRNLQPEEAFIKLRSAMTGETEAVKSLGIVMTEARVEQFAYLNGIAEIGERLTDTQKVIARYGLLLQGASKDQGDMVRTADQFANQIRRLGANLLEVKNAVGEPLLKPMEGFLRTTNDFLVAIRQWITHNRELVSGLARTAASVGTVSGAMGVLTISSYGALKALAALRAGVLALWGALALPATTATAAILGIGAAAYTVRAEWKQNLYGMQTTFGEFVGFVGKGWDWLTDKVGGFARFMYDSIRQSINNTIGLFDALGTMLGTFWDNPTDFFGALEAGKSRYGAHLDYMGDALGAFVTDAKDKWQLLGDIAGSVGDQIATDWDALLKRMLGGFDPEQFALEDYGVPDFAKLLEGATGGIGAEGKAAAAAKKAQEALAQLQEEGEQLYLTLNRVEGVVQEVTDKIAALKAAGRLDPMTEQLLSESLWSKLADVSDNTLSVILERLYGLGGEATVVADSLSAMREAAQETFSAERAQEVLDRLGYMPDILERIRQDVEALRDAGRLDDSAQTLLSEAYWREMQDLPADAIGKIAAEVRGLAPRLGAAFAAAAREKRQFDRAMRVDTIAGEIDRLAGSIAQLGPEFQDAAKAAQVASMAMKAAAQAMTGDWLGFLATLLEIVGVLGDIGGESEEELKGIGAVIEDIKQAADQWISRMADGLLEFVKTGKLAIGDLAQYIADELFKIGITHLVLNPLVDTIGDILPGFAKGGAFEKGRVVDSPEWFKTLDGLALRGEAGTEVLLPAVRLSDGTLGVKALGGGAGNIIINDYRASGADIQVRRNGHDIEITIEDMVDGALGRLAQAGRLDMLLGGYYGLRRVPA